MNLFQLVLKQMRQRSLSTWLTLLSVLLGVALAVAIMICRREARSLFGQQDYGYDVLVGPKSSPLQLVLNTVYQLDKSPGNIPYSLYETLANPRHPQAKIAVPYMVGDTYKAQRIVATLPKLFGLDDAGNPLPPEKVMEYRPGKRYEIASGKVFAANRFEALIGSDITRLTGLKIGDEFQATHGMPAPNQKPDIHAEKWKVVGVLKPTHTSSDRVVFIPLITSYCIFEHEAGIQDIARVKAGQDINKIASHGAHPTSQPATTGAAAEDEEPHHYTLNPDGTINLTLPKNEWLISAVLVRTRGAGGFNTRTLMYVINNRDEASAVNPAEEMQKFFANFLDGTTRLLLLISLLVTIVAAVSILVSIYNSVAARKREIAILRALGATRRRILTLICVEAGLIGLLGGIIGLLAGHLLGAGGSVYMDRLMGQGINWLAVGSEEWLYLIIVVAIAVLAGLVPALKAYRTPVATNLVAG